jgi:CBS domain-containing protein
MQIHALLTGDHVPVHTISEAATVADAIELMASRNTSALIVTRDAVPVGIFAERDVLRAYMRNSQRAFADVGLHEAMTNKLITAHPDDEMATAMHTMLQADIRHLPVVENQQIIGMLTIRDVVKYLMDALAAEIEHLSNYIKDLHEASHD